MAGFLKLSPDDLSGRVVLCCGAVAGIVGCLQHPWPLSNRCEWYTPCPSVVTTKNVSRLCQIVPGWEVGVVPG